MIPNRAVRRGVKGSGAVATAVMMLLTLAPTRTHASCGAENCPLDEAVRHSGHVSFDLSYQYLDQDRIQIGTRRGTVGELPSPEDEVRTLSRIVTLVGRLAPMQRLSVSASLPTIDRSHTHLHHPESGPAELHTFNYSGVGDLSVLGSWTALGGPHAPTFFTLQGGLKLPTGRRHIDAIGDDEPEPPARPGTGSYDGLLGVHVMHTAARHGAEGRVIDAPLFASMMLRINGRGTEDYRVGNELQAAAGATLPVAHGIDVLGQVNLTTHGKDDVGRTDALRDNTGGTSLYASPGLAYHTGAGLRFYGYLQLPVYRNLDRIQLAAPYHVVIGTTYALTSGR